MFNVRHFPKSCLLCVAVAMLLLCGCGDGNKATVSGRVHFNGKPLERGNVVFHPKESGPTAIGSIQPDSTYTMATGATPGLAPGDYRVTVQSSEPVIQPTKEFEGPKSGKRITPDIYGNADTTPLSYSVKPGSNVIDIDLESAN